MNKMLVTSAAAIAMIAGVIGFSSAASACGGYGYDWNYPCVAPPVVVYTPPVYVPPVVAVPAYRPVYPVYVY